MSRVLLKFQGTQQMVNIPSTCLVTLTDENETRQLNVICDSFTKFQLDLRTSSEEIRIDNGELVSDKGHTQLTRLMLPEVLCSIIDYMTDLQLIVVITNVYDGVYSAIIEDSRTGTTFPIKVSEAILLALANKFIPIYIEKALWECQSVPFDKKANGVSIPINSLPIELLEASLEQAIENEQYEKAQQLKDEIDRRKG